MSKIDEIGLEYAHEHGGGLPLSAKEFCNALALWVEEKFNAGIPVYKIADLLKGSDTITLNNNGTAIEIHLNAEVLRDIQKSLKFPVSNPTEIEIVGVDEHGQQVMLPYSRIGGKYYRHNVTLRGVNNEVYFFSYISTNPNPTQPPATDEDYMESYPQARGCILTKQINNNAADEVEINFPLGVFYSFGDNSYELMSYTSAITEIDLIVEISSFDDNVTQL